MDKKKLSAFWQDLRLRLKEWGRELIDFKGTPHQLGVAFGLGILIGVIPGTGLVAAAAAAAILRLNLPVTVAGACLTNPLTMPFIYGAGYALGLRLLGDWLPLHQAARVLVSTVAGTLILSLIAGAAGYLVAFLVILIIRLLKPSSS